MRDWMTDVKARLKGAQLDGMTEQEIAEELAQHLEDRYTDLRARGLTEEAARAQALAELGEGDDLAWDVGRVTTVRDTPLPIGRPSVGNWLAGLASDIGFGARMLLRAPIYAVVAVLIMALGIGVTTVIFIAVNSLLLQPPSGVRDPEQLAALFTSDYSGPRFGSSSWPDVEAVSEAGIFDGVAAYALQTFNVLGNGWQSVGMGEIVSPDYFRALGVRPAAGRFFAPDELTPGKPAGVAVISHALWREQYDASPAAIGSVIHVRGEPLTVIGVAPANFGGTLRGLRTHLWLPVSAPQRVTGVDHRHRGNRGFRVTARLRDGVDIAAAQEQLNVIAARLHQEYPQQWTDVNERSRVFTILPEADARLPAQSRGAVLGFLGLFVVAVLAVLVIACSNVANLTLARAASRRSEMGVRLALGATRGQVVRHLLAENLLLACIGGATGVLLAVWLVRALAAVRVPGLHVTLQVTLDWYVLAFAVGITLATGILFGLAPALRASRAPAPLLKEDARAGTRGRLRHALVVLQVAASLVLLTRGAGEPSTARSMSTMSAGSPDGGSVACSVQRMSAQTSSTTCAGAPP